MTASRPHRGRPRSDVARTAILDAAFSLMSERGFDAMSIEAVATRAGVGKATIYRWWKTKTDVAVDAFLDTTRDELTFPVTGSAREDFRRQIAELAALLRGDRGRALVAMLSVGRGDPEIAAALRERWLGVRRQWGAQRMARAIADRETMPGIDPVAALALLYGPVYTPLLFGNDPPDADAIQAILSLAFAGIFVPMR